MPPVLYETGGFLRGFGIEFRRNEKMDKLPSIDMVKTGENIARLRQQSGLTVKDLQDLFGFTTPQAIYKWQHGAALPTVDNLVVLAAVFGVRIDDILVYAPEE